MQTILYQEYTYKRIRDAYPAFGNMGRGPNKLFGALPSLESIRLMGAGRGNGFSIIPDLKRYAIVSIWQKPEAARDFLLTHPALQAYRNGASSMLAVVMHPLKAHGFWDGKQPFKVEAEAADGRPIAVITRATIKWHKLHEFWWNVPAVSRFMASQGDALHRVGIGEYPLFMQATFSIWPHLQSLQKASYAAGAHAAIVKKTRERGWYAEELFARFQVAEIYAHGSRYAHLSALARSADSPN
jgi:hypothetical protein